MNKIKTAVIFGFIGLMVLPVGSTAQVRFDGDFRLRWYSDSFSETRDSRDKENYFRYSSRLRMKAAVSKRISFQAELMVFSGDSILSMARNIAGTGTMYYGISQLYTDVIQPDFLGLDLVRLRAGRQQFPIGNGLSLGDSYYLVGGLDGVRVDLSKGIFSLSSLAAITGQNLSENGLYPDPGSDQLYAVRLGFPIFDNDFICYYILDKPRGIFNDNQILGTGLNAKKMAGRLEYFAEAAYQQFHTVAGIPEKGGLGYMAGISYRRSLGFFRSVKIETRYAAYEGDDAATPKKEIFSPSYPSFFWGSRTGYVDGMIGGTYPYDGRNPEGSRIWYSRIYFIPKWWPQVRLQFDYLDVSEYIDNDNYNTFDNEFSARFYYNLNNQARLQFRYSENYPNGADRDVNESGTIAWSEDRVSRSRLMVEIQVKF